MSYDMVVTDLTISFSAQSATSPDSQPKWHRIEKNLYPNSFKRRAWLEVVQAEEKDLAAGDLIVTDVKIGEDKPDTGSEGSWQSRPGGIWVLRSKYSGDTHLAVTGVDALFGTDAVDPRPQWTLLEDPFRLETQEDVPIARLTIRHGKVKPKEDARPAPLRAREDGKFKIVQISDTHMVTGPGKCNDAMDADGEPLPESEADPLTVNFIGGVLDVEKPDLVVLTGDQLHHDILDSQSTLFKVVAPFIERSIPFAVIFGNHDDEGEFALSRAAQMSLLQDLPYSLCQPGPEDVDGVSNYYLEVFGRSPSKNPVSTLFLLDSHGQLSKILPHLGYDWIRQTQIDWFTNASQTLRKQREEEETEAKFHLSLAFQHIPLPEFGEPDLIMVGGQRGEQTESPQFNSHFYNNLAQEGVVALGCGHDHVNDFCALQPLQKPKRSPKDGTKPSQQGPWLCYGGSAGFGAYGIYEETRYYRRSRVWELDTNTGSIKTWKRVEYAKDRVDELLLVDAGAVVAPPEKHKESQGP